MALSLGGIDLSVMGIIGIVLLIGIVKRNGITSNDRNKRWRVVPIQRQPSRPRLTPPAEQLLRP
jgi:hypothetical protein